MGSFSSLELCAGAGGQARGLELAGFEHSGVVELDKNCCETLRLNRPRWTVHEEDLNAFDGHPYRGAPASCPILLPIHFKCHIYYI